MFLTQKTCKADSSLVRVDKTIKILAYDDIYYLPALLAQQQQQLDFCYQQPQLHSFSRCSLNQNLIQDISPPEFTHPYSHLPTLL